MADARFFSSFVPSLVSISKSENFACIIGITNYMIIRLFRYAGNKSNILDPEAEER